MKLPAGLLDAIVARPDAPDGYLVAADWLSSHGDAWGELINTQCRLEHEMDPTAFLARRRRADSLIEAHAATWVGAAEAKVDWRWGFVERLALPETPLLDAVLRSDVGSLARALALWGGPEALADALRKILRAKLPRLEALALTGRGQVRAPLPPLRRLESAGLALDWNSVSAAPLTQLFLSDLRDPTLAAWLDTGAPTSLTRLELLEVDLPLGTAERFVDRQASLRTLHLEDDLPDDLARWLAGSPVLSKLDHLALGGPATDVGLDAVLTHFARFARLKTLIFYGGRFGPTLKKWAYKQLPGVVFETRRPAADWTARPR